jgi:uncharacterized protein (DUF2249 family)
MGRGELLAQGIVKVLDVRDLPPPRRHDLIFKEFDELNPVEVIIVVNDHEPVQLSASYLTGGASTLTPGNLGRRNRAGG